MFTFKRVTALVLVAIMTMTMFAGCGKRDNTIDEKAVFMTVNDRKVTAGMANFYVRYQQALIESVYQSYLGDNVWKQEIETGVTYEDSMKDTILQQMKDLYILAENVDEYKVTLTDEEKEFIQTTAQEFEKANSKDAKKKASTLQEYAAEYLELSLIQKKMTDAISKDIDTKVDTEKVAQKSMKYVLFAKKTTDENGAEQMLNDKQIAKLGKDAQALLKEAKTGGSLDTAAQEKGLTVETLAFDKESTVVDGKVIQAADSLKASQFADVIETDDGYYVIQLESEFDQEATQAKVDEILEQRRSERYEELIETWSKKIKITVNEEVWNKMSLHGLKVSSQFGAATTE